MDTQATQRTHGRRDWRARLKLDPLHLKLGLAVSTVVVVALIIGFAVAVSYYDQRLLDLTRREAMLQTGLVRSALEHAMLTNDRALIERMVREFVAQSDFERMMILDHTGQVRSTSDPSLANKVFSISDETCQVCHENLPEARSETVLIHIDGSDVLRSVEPLHNRPPCQVCHGSDRQINGMLIVDVPLSEARSSARHAMRRLAVGAAGLCLCMLAVIAFTFRRLVLRRLWRFQSTARAITRGQLLERVPIEGNDAITEVEVQFNQMADSVVGLLDALKEQQAHLEKIMNSVDDGMVVLDASCRIVAVNTAFERRHGGHADFVGRYCCQSQGSPHASLCQSSDPEPRCLVRTCLESGRGEHSLRTRTGSEGTVLTEEVRTSPVFDAAGKVSHVVEVWRDITDRRSAEARMAEVQRMASLGMLASGFSHEVNTPLHSIGLCLEGIQRLLGTPSGHAQEDDEQINEYAQIALTEVQRVGGMTRQFLELARGRHVARDAVDLQATAERVARLAGPTAKQHEVSLTVEPCAKPPTVLANTASVQQVLLNLLLNAVSASSAGQRVRVTVLDADPVVLRVADEGVGIPAEDLPRVFEPFFSRRNDGTGLGLFLALSMARAWGGDITVESTPGKGTVFAVTFPRQEPPGVSDDSPTDAREDSAGR